MAEALGRLAVSWGVELNITPLAYEAMSGKLVQADSGVYSGIEILNSVLHESDLIWDINEGQLIVDVPEKRWSGASLVLVDVRDLSSAGITSDWAALLNEKVFAEEGAWVGDTLKGFAFENRNGFIYMTVPSSNDDPRGYQTAIRIEEYLSDLRLSLREL